MTISVSERITRDINLSNIVWSSKIVLNDCTHPPPPPRVLKKIFYLPVYERLNDLNLKSTGIVQMLDSRDHEQSVPKKIVDLSVYLQLFVS